MPNLICVFQFLPRNALAIGGDKMLTCCIVTIMHPACGSYSECLKAASPRLFGMRISRSAVVAACADVSHHLGPRRRSQSCTGKTAPSQVLTTITKVSNKVLQLPREPGGELRLCPDTVRLFCDLGN